MLREKRARDFGQNAQAADQARRVDRYFVSDEPKKSKVLGGEFARQFDSSQEAPPATARPKGGGGNPFGKALGAVKDFGGDVVKTGLEVLDAPRKYVGAPAFGVATGLTRSELYTDPETGRQYRKSASLKDVGQSLAAAVKDPIQAYKEGGRATEEYLADPNKNFVHRAAGRVATDPLSFIGPGVARRAGVAVGGKLGAVVREAVDSGGAGVVLGSNITAEADQEYGDRVPGWSKLSPEARTIVAGVLGGVVGHRVATKGPGLSIDTQGRNTPELKAALDRHDIGYEVDSDGILDIKDPNARMHARAVADDLDSQLPWETKVKEGRHHVNNNFFGGTREHHTADSSERFLGRELTPEETIAYRDAQTIRAALDEHRLINRREDIVLDEPWHDDARRDFLDLPVDTSWAKRSKQALAGIERGKQFVREHMGEKPGDLNRALREEINSKASLEGHAGWSALNAEDTAYASYLGQRYDSLRNDAEVAIYRGTDATLGGTAPGVPDDGGRGARPPAGEVPQGPTARPSTLATGPVEAPPGFEDVFGPAPEAPPPPSPTGQQRIDLEGGSKGYKTPLNQESFLGAESDAPPTGDELRQTAPRAEQGVVPSETSMARTGAEEPLPDAEGPSAGEQFDAGPPPLDRTDDWAMLGLKKGQKYSEDEIRQAYRAQMRRYHPDLNPGAEATKDAQDINSAFERLMKGEPEATDFRENARRSEQTRSEQRRANDEARQQRKERENPPPGGGPSGPSSEDWYAAWGTPPPGTKPPKPPKGPSFKHFDDDARYDLFNAESRDAQVRKQETYLNSLRGKVSQAIRNVASRLGGERFDRNLVMDTLVRPFVVGEKGRVDNLINHWTAWAREEAETKLRTAGIRIGKADDGAWRINGDSALPTIEDVIERSTDAGKAFYDSLTPQQRSAIDFIEWANEAVNKTILAHGGELPFDRDISGSYFPRKTIGIDGQERTSGASSFKKSRTMESIEEGLAGDVEYANPWDAFESGMRGKLRHAQDAYLKETLAPLAVKPDSKAGIRAGFGYAHVDHPALQNLLFPQDVADRIKAALRPPDDNIFTKFPKAVNAVLTPLRATGDLSASLQQGMFAWLKNPAKAADHWRATVLSLKDPQVYFKAVDRLEAKGPGFNEHIRWGGHYVNPHSVDDFLMPKVAKALTGGKWDEIPIGGTIARKSNEHFARFLNLVRFDLGNDAYARAKALGLEGRALDDHMREAWNGINRATGWSARKPTTLEQIGLFAPRYFSASIEQVAAALTKGGVEGNIARSQMIRLLTSAATVAWLWNTANGKETTLDPTSSNFLRLRDVGGLDVSLLGTYDTLFRGIANQVAGDNRPGDLERFGWSKLSPTAKLLYEPFVKHSDYLGRPIDMSTPGGAAKGVLQQAKSSLPFGVQNFFEEGPAAAAVGTTGLSNSPLTPAEKRDFRRDEVAKTRFGMAYDQLTGADKSRVNEDPEVARHQSEADRNTLTRDDDRAGSTKAGLKAQSQVQALSDELESGKITGDEFRDQYQRIQDELRGARDVLKVDGKKDKVLDGWFQLYDIAETASGKLDYDRLETLQREYERVHPDVQERLASVTGTKDNETMRQYREAKKLAQAYYDIPAYRGMNAKDSTKASRIMMLASEMVSFGQARNRNHAFALLAADDPIGVSLARRATSAGPNPQRAAFRKDPRNKLFAKFYGPGA